MSTYENDKTLAEGMEILTDKAGGFFKKAFQDMKDSAIAQHEVDKANFAAAKAESRAQWEEARAMGSPEKRRAAMQRERDAELAKANERISAAQARIEKAKKD